MIISHAFNVKGNGNIVFSVYTVCDTIEITIYFTQKFLQKTNCTIEYKIEMKLFEQPIY